MSKLNWEQQCWLKPQWFQLSGACTEPRDLFPHDQLTLCRPGKMPPGSASGFWAAHYLLTPRPLWEAAKASTLACQISSLPKHFMVSSVTANWWVGIPGLRHSRNTHAHAQACMHTHIFGYERWPLAACRVWVQCQAPSWALHRIKSSSVPQACCTGFRHCSPSAPQTIPIVLLFNEEESTWKN